MDGIGYAATVKWNFELFGGHHLLYNPLVAVFYKISPFDALETGKIINALFAAAILWLFYGIIQTKNKEDHKAFWLVFFLGSSFAIMRFATENETYIVPIFFSLLGTYYYLKNQTHKNKFLLFWSGLWLSIACLFHQIHFFWWLITLAFLAYQEGVFSKKTLFFAISAWTVPIVYVLVLTQYYHRELSFSNLSGLVFETFHSGSSSLQINLIGIARQLVSMARTFIQIHHFSLFFMLKFQFLLLFAIFFVAVFVYYIFKWKPKFRLSYEMIYLLAISMVQLFFALLSLGNSEFMVMIPVLVALIFHYCEDIDLKKFKILAITLFCWNVLLGLVPSHFFQFSPYPKILPLISKNPNSKFITDNYGTLLCLNQYKTGQNLPNLLNMDGIATYEIIIDSLLQKNEIIYTNLGKNALLFDTGYFLKNNKDDLSTKYHLTVWDSVETFRGKHYLYRVISKR